MYVITEYCAEFQTLALHHSQIKLKSPVRELNKWKDLYKSERSFLFGGRKGDRGSDYLGLKIMAHVALNKGYYVKETDNAVIPEFIKR